MARQDVNFKAGRQSWASVAESFTDNPLETVAQVRFPEAARYSDPEAGGKIFTSAVAENEGSAYPLLTLQKSLKLSLFEEAGLLGKV